MSNAIMNLLKAESLLADSFVLTQVESFKNALNYRTDDNVVSFDDHFIFLQASIDKIQRIKLQDSVSKGTGAKYENELLSALEEIQDQVEKWTIKVIRFQGDIMRAKSDSDELRSAFESWYYLAALTVLQEAEIKLPAANIKSLASSEFSRLMNRTDVSLEALIEALKIEVKRLDGKRKMAKTKFDMGREQVNASWANVLPNALGISGTGPAFGVLSDGYEDDEDEVDGDEVAYVSKNGEVKSITSANTDTGALVETLQTKLAEADAANEISPLEGGVCTLTEISIPEEKAPVETATNVVEFPDVTAEQLAEAEAAHPLVTLDLDEMEIPEIKGTFVKTGTPQPATIVHDPEEENDEEDQDEEDEAEAEIEGDAGYHIELDAEASAPDLTDVSDGEMEHLEDEMLAQAEAANLERMFEATEVSLVDKKDVVDPTVGIVEPAGIIEPVPVRSNVVVFDDDDLEEADSSPVKEEVIPEPVAVVETPKPVVEAAKPAATPVLAAATPVATRKPLNFDFDDDEL